MDFTSLASEEIVQKTSAALKNNGIESFVVDNGTAAKAKVLELIPDQSTVMTMQSMTLKALALPEAIDGSRRFKSVRKELEKYDRKTQHVEMSKLAGHPNFAVGSVHAVTEDGKVLIASNTGSQLDAYVYGAQHVIWIVGTQKIVPDLDFGFKRIYEYCLPLESERLHSVYPQIPGSFVSKILIVNKEVQPGRITLIFVKEKLGF